MAESNQFFCRLPGLILYDCIDNFNLNGVGRCPLDAHGKADVRPHLHAFLEYPSFPRSAYEGESASDFVVIVGARRPSFPSGDPFSGMQALLWFSPW